MNGLEVFKGMFESAAAAYGQGRPREAEDIFYRCSRMAPGVVEVWNNLGMVRQSMGDFDGMVKCFEEALQHFQEGTNEHTAVLGNWKAAKKLLKAKRAQEKAEKAEREAKAKAQAEADAEEAAKAAADAAAAEENEDDEAPPKAAPLRTEHGVEVSAVPASITATEQSGYSGTVRRLKTQEEWQALEEEMRREEEYGVNGEEPTNEPDADKRLFKWFEWIYKRQDEDGRRAMNKSMCQSNSTVLTTNWRESANTEYEDARKVEEEKNARKEKGLMPKEKENPYAKFDERGRSPYDTDDDDDDEIRKLAGLGRGAARADDDSEAPAGDGETAEAVRPAAATAAGKTTVTDIYGED